MNGNCIYCGTLLTKVHSFGAQPYANFLMSDPYDTISIHPLTLCLCEKCSLVQVNKSRFQFTEGYPYQSSFGSSYVKQCEEFYKNILINDKKDITITEIGCNDGYLLKSLKAMGFEKLYGYEPVPSLCKQASQYGTIIQAEFDLASFGMVPRSDLVILNNVFAHTPKLIEIVSALRLLTHEKSRVIIEVQDFDELVRNNYWDTIYHEHVSYFTEESLFNVVSKHFLIEQITKIPSHGGSKRYTLRPKAIPDYSFQPRKYEFDAANFSRLIVESKLNALRQLLTWKKTERKTIACFGAAAKGISFLNYLGVDSDIISFCIDETPTKVGRFMPKSRIPIASLENYRESKFTPDIMLILPWNFASEILKKLNHPETYVPSLEGFKKCVI